MVFLTAPVSIESLVFPRDLSRAELLRGTQYKLVNGRKGWRGWGRGEKEREEKKESFLPVGSGAKFSLLQGILWPQTQ